MLRALLRDPRTATAAGALAGLTALGIVAPWLAPADPAAQHHLLQTRFLPPLTAGPDTFHWLGTDRLGRDLLSRLMVGARISMTVGILSVLVSVALGYAVGVTASLAGGAVERTLMAVTDAALAMPRLVLLLALVALFEPTLPLVVLVLGFTGWMSIARLARAETKGALARPYVEAARAMGVPRTRLLARHLLPNTLTGVIVAAALAVGNAIALESGLSFLGLGVPPPTPSWGNMIAGGRDALVQAPWIATLPGLAIVVAVVACNVLGDGLRDALDPRLANR